MRFRIYTTVSFVVLTLAALFIAGAAMWRHFAPRTHDADWLSHLPKAMRAAESAGGTALAQRIANRLKLYDAEKPFRDTSLVDDASQ